MAHSPAQGVERDLDSYRSGWKAVIRMTQESLSWSGREPNCVFLNRDGRAFADVSCPSGLDFRDDARAAAPVDWDQDGRLDLWLANRTAPQVRFMRNVAPADGSFLALRLRGTTSNRDAIGARVELELEGSPHPKLIQTLHAGDGYLSQGSKWLHFGLARGATIRAARVRWPGGASEEFPGLEPDRRYELVQGSGQATPWRSPHGEVRLAPSDPEVPAFSGRSRMLLAERIPLPELSAVREDGQPLALSDASSRPTLINIWASWCQPCQTELTDFARRSTELSGKGLRVVALSVDEPDDRTAARDFLARVQWPFEAGYAPAKLLDTFDVLQRTVSYRRRRLPLPTSFLVNGERELVAIYRGPVEVTTVLADLGLCRASLDELRDEIAPLDGRWISRATPAPDLASSFARELTERGLADAAARFLLLLRPPPGTAQDAPVREYIGRLLVSAREFAELGAFGPAADLYRRALEVDPAGFEMRLNLAVCLARVERWSEAEAEYRRVLEQRPKNAQARLGLAELLLRGLRSEEAVEVLEALLEARPDQASAHWLLAQACEATGDPSRALEHARRALELDPGLEEARSFLAARGAGSPKGGR